MRIGAKPIKQNDLRIGQSPLSIGNQFRIADEQQIAADAVTAIGCDQRQRLSVSRNGDIQYRCLIFSQFKLLKLQIVINENGKIGERGRSSFGGPKADHARESQLVHAGLASQCR